MKSKISPLIFFIDEDGIEVSQDGEISNQRGLNIVKGLGFILSNINRNDFRYQEMTIVNQECPIFY